MPSWTQKQIQFPPKYCKAAATSSGAAKPQYLGPTLTEDEEYGYVKSWITTQSTKRLVKISLKSYADSSTKPAIRDLYVFVKVFKRDSANDQFRRKSLAVFNPDRVRRSLWCS